MNRNSKGRDGWRQATPKTSTLSCSSKRRSSHIKVVIVILALRGLLPVPTADWLICRGVRRDV